MKIIKKQLGSGTMGATLAAIFIAVLGGLDASLTAAEDVLDSFLTHVADIYSYDG